MGFMFYWFPTLCWHDLRCVLASLDIVTAQARRRVGALPIDFERHLVPLRDFPLEIQALSPGREFRSVIVNISSLVKYFEVEWGPDRHCLWDHADRGSIGFPSKVALFTEGGVRGDALGDISHIRHDGVLKAWRDAGLGLAKGEIMVVMTVLKGAFGRQANYRKIGQAARQLLRNFSYKNPLFRGCYAGIVRDQTQGSCCARFGTDEHMEEVWVGLQQSQLLRKTWALVKVSRWFAFQRKHATSHRIGKSLRCTSFTMASTSVGSKAHLSCRSTPLT